MLAADCCKPVLPLVAVDIVRCLAVLGRREPVRPFPTELLAEACTCVEQPCVQRRHAARPAAVVLLARPGHGVVLAVGLECASAHPVGVLVGATETADVDDPQVVGSNAAVDPFSKCHAGATAGGDPERVEAGTDEEVLQLRCLAE